MLKSRIFRITSVFFPSRTVKFNRIVPSMTFVILKLVRFLYNHLFMRHLLHRLINKLAKKLTNELVDSTRDATNSDLAE